MCNGAECCNATTTRGEKSCLNKGKEANAVLSRFFSRVAAPAVLGAEDIVEHADCHPGRVPVAFPNTQVRLTALQCWVPQPGEQDSRCRIVQRNVISVYEFGFSLHFMLA